MSESLSSGPLKVSLDYTSQSYLDLCGSILCTIIYLEQVFGIYPHVIETWGQKTTKSREEREIGPLADFSASDDLISTVFCVPLISCVGGLISNTAVL